MGHSRFSLASLDGLSKPLTKLIETVGRGIGVVYEPTRIRRRARADASALVVLAEAEVEAETIRQRTIRRLINREEVRQENLERIVEAAGPQLPPSVAEEPVSADWTARFLDAGQDVSDSEVQQLWSRILAGEVAQPGTFSIRTVEMLRLMDHKDATLVGTAASHAVRLDDRPILVTSDSARKCLLHAGLTNLARHHLISIGVLQDGLAAKITESPGVRLEYGCNTCTARASALIPAFAPMLMYEHFTETGTQILRLCDVQYRQEYWESILSDLQGMRTVEVTTG